MNEVYNPIFDMIRKYNKQNDIRRKYVLPHHFTIPPPEHHVTHSAYLQQRKHGLLSPHRDRRLVQHNTIMGPNNKREERSK